MRLRDDDKDWGISREEYSRRVRGAILRKERARAEVSRMRNENGRFIARAPSIEMPKPGEVFMTSQGPAYQVTHCGDNVSLPWVSILGKAAA